MYLSVCVLVCVQLPHQASLLFVACYKFYFCFCLTVLCVGWGQAAYAARRTFCIHMLNIYSQAKQSVNYVGVSLSHSHSPPLSLSLALSPFVCLALCLAHAYLIRWAHHFLKGLGTSSNSCAFFSLPLFLGDPIVLWRTCPNLLQSAARHASLPRDSQVNHICHMRDFQHVIWRSPSQLHFTFQIRKRIRNEIENRIQFPKSSVCNQCGQLDCWSRHTLCAINA